MSQIENILKQFALNLSLTGNSIGGLDLVETERALRSLLLSEAVDYSGYDLGQAIPIEAINKLFDKEAE